MNFILIYMLILLKFAIIISLININIINIEYLLIINIFH